MEKSIMFSSNYFGLCSGRFLRLVSLVLRSNVKFCFINTQSFASSDSTSESSELCMWKLESTNAARLCSSKHFRMGAAMNFCGADGGFFVCFFFFPGYNPEICCAVHPSYRFLGNNTWSSDQSICLESFCLRRNPHAPSFVASILFPFPFYIVPQSIRTAKIP